MEYRELKKRHRAERDAYPQSTSLRLHRALSWLDRAERSGDDLDAQFIFLWIAFNAAYATTFDDEPSRDEQRRFAGFLNTLIACDSQRRIEHLLWQEYANTIRVLLENQYVFPDFWRYQSGLLREGEWRERFTRARRKAFKHLSESNVQAVLGIVLQRIYTLRNQLVHGGATWNGKANRPQLRDCVRLMGKLVPLVIALMMDHPQVDWGSVAYPYLHGEAPADDARDASGAR